jgi:hypothetical protein
LPENRLQAKAMPAEETDMSAKTIRAPAKIIRPGMVVIRLAEANHLAIRHLIFLADIRMPAKLLSVTAVTRGKTAMMMVIRPWREPVI